MNKTLRIAGLILLFAGIAVLAMGLGGQEKNGDKIRVTGRLRMVGSSPLSELVISTENREWYIDKKDEAPLRDLQQQIITVEGRETFVDLIFANGTPAGRRYTLQNITLID